MKRFLPLISLCVIFAAAVNAQPLSPRVETAFQNAVTAATSVPDPTAARRQALRAYESELAASAFTAAQKAMMLAAKCAVVAEVDYYALLKYFLSDIQNPMMLPTLNALPSELRDLVKRDSRQIVADYQAKQKGGTAPTLEQRVPPGVGWRQIASGVGAAKVPGTGGVRTGDSTKPFYGNVVEMNPRSADYLKGSWRINIVLPGTSTAQTTTWIFDIDGIATVRVDAKTASPTTQRYWMSDPTKVLFDYAGGRVELTLSGEALNGFLRSPKGASARLYGMKVPDLDYERWGDAAMNDRQFELAEQYFDRAISARYLPDYLAKRAKARYEQKRYKDAISDLDRAIGLNSRFATAYYNRAVTYAVLGELQKALSDAAKAVSIGGKDIAAYYHLRGQIYRRLGDRDAAISDFRSTLRINPKHSQARQDLIKYGVTP